MKHKYKGTQMCAFLIAKKQAENLLAFDFIRLNSGIS